MTPDPDIGKKKKKKTLEVTVKPPFKDRNMEIRKFINSQLVAGNQSIAVLIAKISAADQAQLYTDSGHRQKALDYFSSVLPKELKDSKVTSFNTKFKGHGVTGPHSHKNQSQMCLLALYSIMATVPLADRFVVGKLSQHELLSILFPGRKLKNGKYDKERMFFPRDGAMFVRVSKLIKEAKQRKNRKDKAEANKREKAKEKAMDNNDKEPEGDNTAENETDSNVILDPDDVEMETFIQYDDDHFGYLAPTPGKCREKFFFDDKSQVRSPV